MSHINFVIPQNKGELLSENDDTYYVRNIVSVKELRTSVKLKEAKQCLKDEGAEFIIDNFDTYYSVLHYADSLEVDILTRAHDDLLKGIQTLNNVLGFLLDDKDSLNDEVQVKYLNVIKMLMYVYNNIVTVIEQKAEFKRSQTLQKGKGRKKNDDDSCFQCDKREVILALNNILQREINIFWDPPVVEESFVNMMAEVCYRFLEIPSLKSDKELRTELFNMLGTLIKHYNHGMTFVVRIVQLIKIHEHIVHCIAEGIQILVHNYNCKSLIRDFVREITEWQTEETYPDVQGTRHCSMVLTSMASLMPDLMIPEVVYLCAYLGHDSYALRNSVLSVITEVILTVLTTSELTEEQRESRDELLSILEDHTADVAALVRSKVFQNWAKLQQENAIPMKIQSNILSKAVLHLRDKAANVRKSAASCVTTFLSHNIYGAQLHLDKLQAELVEKQQLLEQIRDKLDIDRLEHLQQMKEQWLSKQEDIKKVIHSKLQEKDGCGDAPTDSQMSKDALPEVIRLHVLEGKYEEAFELCRSAGSGFQDWKDARASMSIDEQVDLYLNLILAIFMDVPEAKSTEDGIKSAPTENDLKRLEALQNSVNYLSGATEFLKLIDDAIPLMSDLLESVSIGDMQEAVQFFISAYQFNINNSQVGVLEMLKIMQRSEEERKNHVIEAFKTIYLTTDSTSMIQHTTTIVTRLINLVKTVPFDNYQHLKSIISEWVIKSILDNAVIDILWQYFTKKIDDVSDDDSRAALHLLIMAAAGRRTIASKNIKLVAAVAFGERSQNDILLAVAGCQMLTVAGTEKVDPASKTVPFKLKQDEQLWKDLMDILVTNFPKMTSYYNSLMSSAVECVYALCSTPDKFCETLIHTIVNSLATGMVHKNLTELDGRIIAQVLHMFGEVALKEMNFLDESVYNEMKRRTQIMEERKNNKKIKSTVSKNASSTRRRKTGGTTDSSIQNVTTDTASTEESTLEGASAVDTEADYILDIVENHIVTDNTGLGKLSHLFINVCRLEETFDDAYLQGTAITAFLRYMIISSQFCTKHLQLIFTILEKSKYPHVKCNILIHSSDILSRLPNVMEPWLPYVYARLKDPSPEVRKVALYVIANLILRDMIRVQGRLSGMACLMVDPEETLRNMSKNFFIALSRKANLYNMFPDIFSHLSDLPDLGQDNLRFIMKFLFGLIEKNKQMENLVDRFCSKFRLTDDDYKCCNIAYCLTLIQYNEKGLQHLSESFVHYKHVLELDEVHTFFKQILSSHLKSAKNEIKDLAKEIEDKINAVFEMNEDGQPPNADKAAVPSTNTEKQVFKKPRGRAPKKKAKKSQKGESDDSDGEPEKENNLTPSRRSARSRQKTNKVVVDYNSDDSD